MVLVSLVNAVIYGRRKMTMWCASATDYLAFFFCFQFEPEFSPSRLRNWEIPKWYRGRPLQRTSATKIISDDRGHLLPGVNR